MFSTIISNTSRVKSVSFIFVMSRRDTFKRRYEDMRMLNVGPTIRDAENGGPTFVYGSR